MSEQTIPAAEEFSCMELHTHCQSGTKPTHMLHCPLVTTLVFEMNNMETMGLIYQS